MNLLAFETATERCSVALLSDGRLLERSVLAPRRHAELALPMASELLAEAGLARAALDGIAVGRGPGAFTGVRLAISLAQGIAYALDRPVLPISTLAALAEQAPRVADRVLALLDARMGELYVAAFARGANGELALCGPERVATPEQLALPPAPRWHVVGTGWEAQSERLAAAWPHAVERVIVAEARWPEARDIALLAAPRLAHGDGVAPEQALPVYLRDKVAETQAERAAKA